MTFEQLVFYFFATLAIAASMMVVAAKNSVHAVLYLVFTFFCAAALWMLLESEFLSIVLVLVYVGAVMVLFLFVVMMLDIEIPNKAPFVKHWPFGILIAGCMLTLMVIMVGKSHFGLEIVPAPAAKPLDFSSIKTLGTQLFSNYLLPFEIAGVILLVAMVAAIGLAYRGPRDVKTQKPGDQAQVRKDQRLSVIKMPSEGEHS